MWALKVLLRHVSSWKTETAEVAYAHGSLVSFACLLSAFYCTAVQIHAKLIIELKSSEIYQMWSLSVQVGRGSNALYLCGIALVPACWGHGELFCTKVNCEMAHMYLVYILYWTFEISSLCHHLHLVTNTPVMIGFDKFSI